MTDSEMVPAQSSLGQVIAAWWSLLIFDLLLHVGGLRAVMGTLRTLERRRRLVGNEATHAATASICMAVARARLVYPRHAFCVQSAAATTGLLRLAGLPGDFVIGVRRMPFAAHAWVEVGDRVVMNHEPHRMHIYHPIERC